MKTFFLNTCTSRVSLAIFEDDELLGHSSWTSDRREAHQIHAETEKLLKEKGLSLDMVDRIAVCIGPGGFTSTRLGVSIANAWAFAKDLSLAPFTVFDLFPGDAFVALPCNASEAWIRHPGKEPEFVTGSYAKTADQETFLLPSTLHFDCKQALPWYYKDANITWSKRIHQHA